MCYLAVERPFSLIGTYRDDVQQHPCPQSLIRYWPGCSAVSRMQTSGGQRTGETGFVKVWFAFGCLKHHWLCYLRYVMFVQVPANAEV